MNKKAQLQIMENAFVLLAIFVVIMIAFVMVMGFVASGQRDKAMQYKELAMVKHAQVLSFLPELQCTDNNNLDPDCYDIYKIESFMQAIQNDQLYYNGLLGHVKIDIKSFNPSPEENDWVDEWLIYDNPPNEDNGARAVQFPILLFNPTNSRGQFGVVFLEVYE